MPILIILAVVIMVVILFGPTWWIRHVLKRHGVDRPDLPGTGSELARHLLDEAGMRDIKVELTGDGDHYDPESRTVRLTPAHYDGRSIAAAAVAAHEVSHALQHGRGEKGFARRFNLVKRLSLIDRIASGVLVLAPLVFLIVKAPFLLVLQIVCGLLLLAIRVVVHVVTLPVEFDASFAKALPALERGRYLAPKDMPAARDVLRAAAYTYVAAALATLLDIARWFRILRF